MIDARNRVKEMASLAGNGVIGLNGVINGVILLKEKMSGNGVIGRGY
jgi:hypothetical protein